MANSVKIQDVAASAGVSTATVSYVMNGKDEVLGITPATRERVLEAIQRTGYRPNRAAREMAIGQQSADSLPVTPSPDLATILAAAGYSLVPVTSVNDLPQLPGGGMVGMVYKREVRSQPALRSLGEAGELEVSWSRDALVPEVTDQAPELRDEGVPAPTQPVPEVTPQVVPPVDADACGEPSRTVPAASVTKENSPGTDGAGTSPSTYVAEPVAVDPVAEPTWSRDALVPEVTDQAPELRDEGVPAPVEPVSVAAPPSTTQQPNNPTTVLPPEPVTAAIPDAAIVSEVDIKAPEVASAPEPAIAEEQESEAENNEKSQV